MANYESGRFTVVMAKGQQPMLVDTWWGSAWRLYGDKWKYVEFSGDAVPARMPPLAPEDVPENFHAPDEDAREAGGAS